jgi:hypothetical protein
MLRFTNYIVPQATKLHRSVQFGYQNVQADLVKSAGYNSWRNYDDNSACDRSWIISAGTNISTGR